MKASLTAEDTEAIFSELASANNEFNKAYPGDSSDRQPVHTVYGGAQLFKSGFAAKLGGLGKRALDTFAPNFSVFAQMVGLPGAESIPASGSDLAGLTKALESDPESVRVSNYPAWLAHTIYSRVLKKLASEPVEDNRIDFEDGYGNRPDDEEDAHAENAAKELAKAMADGTVSPFIGFRIKSFTEECRRRGSRTLDIFLSTLNEETQGKVPENFVVTLPKITTPDQVTALVRLLEKIEDKTDFAKGSLKLETMIETTQAIIGKDGRHMVPLIVQH